MNSKDYAIAQKVRMALQSEVILTFADTKAVVPDVYEMTYERLLIDGDEYRVTATYKAGKQENVLMKGWPMQFGKNVVFKLHEWDITDRSEEYWDEDDYHDC